jgi:hypothetical protein
MGSSDPLKRLAELDREQEKLAEQRAKLATSALESLRVEYAEWRDKVKDVQRRARELCEDVGMRVPSWASTDGGAARSAPAAGGDAGGKRKGGGRRSRLAGPYAGMSQEQAILGYIGSGKSGKSTDEIKDELLANGGASRSGIGVAISKLVKEGKLRVVSEPNKRPQRVARA